MKVKIDLKIIFSKYFESGLKKYKMILLKQGIDAIFQKTNLS